MLTKYFSLKTSLPKNPPDCSILWKWDFDNFILAEELFTKAL